MNNNNFSGRGAERASAIAEIVSAATEEGQTLESIDVNWESIKVNRQFELVPNVHIKFAKNKGLLDD